MGVGVGVGGASPDHHAGDLRGRIGQEQQEEDVQVHTHIPSVRLPRAEERGDRAAGVRHAANARGRVATVTCGRREEKPKKIKRRLGLLSAVRSRRRHELPPSYMRL